mmetsp:Transcript_13656/g.21537  ORF Transcript_13656/g.21537 Transcript_13656/m.21537 type:complete len:375 (-) Transcript_13656:198-1322(-)
MKLQGLLLASSVALLLLQTHAFVSQLRLPTTRFAPALCRGAPALRMSIYNNDGSLRGPENSGSKADDTVRTHRGQRVDREGSQGGKMADLDYTGFVDAKDGFDGGDGQVGVVGDGSNAMESFDNREVIDNQVGGRGKVSGGTVDGRVDKRWNAWGADETDVSFQEDLIARGITQIDAETGEDLRRVQRQQYENWFKQRKTWANEKALREQMEAVGGDKRQSHSDDYKAFLDTGKTQADPDNSNVIFATGAKGVDNTELLIKEDWKPCEAGTRIDGEFEIKGAGIVSIMLEPNSMVQEQFIARLTADTPGTFVVAVNAYDLGDREVRGDLPRRGTEKEFVVRYTPSGPVGPPEVATLVIDAEDGWKWTYKIVGST